MKFAWARARIQVAVVGMRQISSCLLAEFTIQL